MHSRWFNAAVILLWLTTMAWLVTEKILPPLLIGEPPNARTVLAAQQNEPPVGWTMTVDGEPLGWAVNRTERLENDITQINSLVQFERVSLAQFVPDWVGGLIDEPMAEFGMQAESTLIIDSLGRLSSFNAQVRFMPLHEAISLLGEMDGNTLKLELRSGTYTHRTQTVLHSEGLLADALSPQSQLPGLRLGQKWTVPVYSPLRSPREPLEILIATVEAREPIYWNGRQEQVWLVIYRPDPGTSTPGDGPRGRVWVRSDGTVIRQELNFLHFAVLFERLPDEEAAALAERAQKEKMEYLASVPVDQPPPKPAP